MGVVLTIGTFDPPHIGHANLFRQCRELGDSLVVGVNSDAFVQAYRGEPALYDETARADLVRPFADRVFFNNNAGRKLILLVQPDILVVGSDWAPPTDYAAQIDMTAAELAELGITLAFVPRTPGISATDLKTRIFQRSR